MLYVKDLMTTEVFSLRKEDTVSAARSLMNLARIRHVPIVDDQGNFIGIITHRDILAAAISRLAGIDHQTQEELDATIPLNELMRKDVQVATPEMTLRQAAAILLEHKYGCLPVVDGERLVGIITEADFLKLVISLMDKLEA